MKDYVECWFCANYVGTPLYLNPVDATTDNDSVPDGSDAYPGDGSATGELGFSRFCDDPTGNLTNDFRDPEFAPEHHLVTWVKDDPNNVLVEPELWVATVASDGGFGSKVKVDDDGVLSISENTANGSEWLYDDAKGAVILYGKAAATGGKNVHYAYKSGANWVTSQLVTNGTAPMGTLLGEDTTPGVSFIRKVNNVWTHMFCPFNGCSGSYPKAGPEISVVPPDLMRLAWGRTPGSSDWLLVGVDYDYLQSSSNRRLRSWEPALNTPALLSPDEAPDKYTGWMFRITVGQDTKDLVITQDLVFTGSNQGPGVIRIYNDTDDEWWQTIPVGPLTHPYVESPEPFLAHDGDWYVTFAASTVAYGGGPTRVVLAQIDPDGVSGGGVNTSMVVRRVDAGVETSPPFNEKWKDPEGFAYDAVRSFVYTTSNNNETMRCISGIPE